MVLLFSDGRFSEAFSGQPIPVGEGLSGWVAHSGRPIINGNPTVEPTFFRGSPLFTENSSALSIPLFDLRGVVFGALTLCASGNAAFSRNHLRALQAAETDFSLALENALRVHAASVDAGANPGLDPLTGLMNARGFFTHVEARIDLRSEGLPGGLKEESRDAAQPLALVLCDLMSFKSVNDRYGYLVGDNLLRALAREFRLCLREGDAIARTGGDEFAVLFAPSGETTAETRIQALQEAANRARAQLRIESDISLCAGIAMHPHDGVTAEELLGAAERRLVQNKQLYYDERRRAEAHSALVQSALEGSYSL
jgi:diguanylate cyclase (GGDEF)-like protein